MVHITPKRSIHERAAEALGTSDRGTELFIVLTTVLGVAWVFVLLRAYTRFFVIKRVATDDWWMFAAMVAYTGYSFDAIYGIVEGGTGRHVDEITVREILIGLKAWYISEVLYAPVSAMVRTSVALFLFRVSVLPIHRHIIVVVLSVIWVITFIFLGIVTFQCDPPNYFYDQVLGLQGKCLDISVVPNVTIAHSAIGAVCDLAFASLPVAILWDVQLNKRTKVVIAVLLGMGFVAGIALLVRIPFVRVLAISPDFLFETIDVAIWSVLEPSLGIIAGCIATLRPLFKGLGIGRPSVYSWSTKRTRPSGAGTGSQGTWFSRSGHQLLEDGGVTELLTPAAPQPLDPRSPSGSRVDRAAAPTASSVYSTDIELSGVEIPHLDPRPPKAVQTNIESRREPWSFYPIERSLGGITVQTCIHTTSQLREAAEQERCGGTAVKGSPLPSLDV